MSSTYKSNKVDLNDKDLERNMEEIMVKKIRKTMKEKGFIDLSNVIMIPFFSKKTLEYLNPRKQKPLAIYPYNSTKGPIYHVKTF